ncbi:MAG: D-alanyl-D-alanine carboxypeptidase [Holosporales bacterium]|nr:D-alanyl-D-alanine carboxypeptidase [Holosporales bacterium]
MIKVFCFLSYIVITSFLTSATAAQIKAYAPPKYSAVVIDAGTGQVMYEENSQEQVYPASLTKMMTLLLTFEALKSGRLSMNQTIKISRRASVQAPSKLGLRPGAKISIKDAMLAIATKSANDVAVALAEALGKTEENFARLMSRKARSIGMMGTTFKNASGLPAYGQKTTAMDIAKLSMHLIKKYPEYYKLFSTKVFSYYGWRHRNHNGLLWSKRDGLRYDGIKTGYIGMSGFNLAASAIKDNRRMIAVVMGGKTRRDRDNRVNLLLQAAFDGLFWPQEYKSVYRLGKKPPQFTVKNDPIAEIIAVSIKPSKKSHVENEENVQLSEMLNGQKYKKTKKCRSFSKRQYKFRRRKDRQKSI